MTPRKIMLLGDIGVGKSSLARRLAFDQFEPEYTPTLGVDIYSYAAPAAGTAPADERYLIWDADGNFRDAILSLIYVKNAAGALIVGDLTRADTLETMLKLGRSFMQAMPGRYCGLLLNKSDLVAGDSDLPPDLLHSPIPHVRTSAKTGENVGQAFLRAADAIRRGL